MAADRLIDRAMVHAGAATDAAQHVLEFAAEHRRAAVVEQNDVIFLGPIGIAGAARAGGERRIDRHVLPGRRAREHAQQLRGVVQRRHQLFQRGDDDMDLGQDLRKIAVALVGDDDGGPGLGDEEIGAGDADVRGEELIA